MTIDINPISKEFAAEITGLSIERPLNDDTRDDIISALDTYATVVVRGAPVSQEKQIGFALRFGSLDEVNGVLSTGIERRVRPELTDVSNIDADKKLFDHNDRRRLFNLGNRLWHTDSSFKRVAAKYSMLHAHTVVPEGGETQVCDLRAAYDALDNTMKSQILDLVAVHSIYTSRSILGFNNFSEEERLALPPICRPLVREHPGSKRKTLYLASHAGQILGLTIADGRLLIRELMEHASQRKFIYTHKWRVGDLLIWDNRCTMHRVRPFDEDLYKRDMRRATVMEMEKGQVYEELS